jgi:hypothetical protein
LSLAELTRRADEFNAIDNLAPLAKSGVKILHIHGDRDELVSSWVGNLIAACRPTPSYPEVNAANTADVQSAASIGLDRLKPGFQRGSGRQVKVPPCGGPDRLKPEL